MTDHRAHGDEWVGRTIAALTPVTDLFPRAPGVKVPWDDLVRLDQYAVLRAANCLRAADSGDDYVDSTRNARRRVGAAVLKRAREDGVPPVVAFRTVLDDRDALFTDRLAGWIESLGPGGQAALGAEAVTWATVVGSWSPVVRMDHGDCDINLPGTLEWELPGRAVRVRARADVLAPRGARPAGRRLLVVTSNLLDAEVVAGHTALGYTLARASVPASVAVLAPASGAERFAVDDRLLDDALERLVAAAHAAVAARTGPPAAATPGRWCLWCGLRDDCDESAVWQQDHPVRFGGLRPSSAADVAADA